MTSSPTGSGEWGGGCTRWSSGLRRRDRCPQSMRVSRSRRDTDARTQEGFPAQVVSSSQCDSCPPWRGNALVRLVRVQRRERTRGLGDGHRCVRRDQHRRRIGDAWLDAPGYIPERKSRLPSEQSRVRSPGLSQSPPACGFVTPLAAVVIGFGVSGICYWTLNHRSNGT